MRPRLVLALACLLCTGPAPPASAVDSSPDLPPDSLTADSTLSLPAVERWVVARNPDLEAMRQQLAMAQARTGMEGALMDPRFEVSVAPRTLAGGGDMGAVYRIGVEQMLPWATLGARRSVARAEARADSAEVERMRFDVLRMARQAYTDYVRGAAARRITEELQRLTEQFRRVALDRYAAALAGESDPLMAESEGARLEHEAVMADRMHETARAQLNQLLRRAWNAPLPPAAAGLPAPRELPPLPTLVSWAVRVRPDVAAAAAREQAGAARVRLAGREAWPDLGVMTAYDRFMVEEPMRWMVGVSFTVPLWLGRVAAARREARAELAMARAQSASARDRVAFEVEEAYRRVADSAHEARLFREAEMPVSQRALGAALAGYQAGKNDLLTLINAERDVGRVRLEELRVLAEHQAALADLERAVGVPVESVLSGSDAGGSR